MSRKEREQKAIILSKLVLGIADDTWGSLVEVIPISQIRTDEKRFQNRDNRFSKRSFDSIVNAVHEGTFNHLLFDAITLWEDEKGDLFVLSGHSRLAAFRKLAEEGNLQFASIPAKVFRGSEGDAIEMAMGSNVLSTEEKPWERAQYYRKKREGGMSKKAVKELARKTHLSNAPTIIALSYLAPDGIVMEALHKFDKAAKESDDMLRLIVIAKWTGTILEDHPKLTPAHEAEIFRHLSNGGHVGALEDFRKTCRIAYKKWEAKGDRDAPLNITGAERLSAEEKHYRNELSRLNRELADMKFKFSEDVLTILSNGVEKNIERINSQERLAEVIEADIEQVVRIIGHGQIPAIVRVRKEISEVKEKLAKARANAEKGGGSSLFGPRVTLEDYMGMLRYTDRNGNPVDVAKHFNTRELKAGDELMRNYLEFADEELVQRAINQHLQNVQERQHVAERQVVRMRKLENMF